MATLGILGSTELSEDERAVVVEYANSFFAAHPEIVEVVHLRSKGVEETVVNIARDLGIPNESIPIHNYTWNGDLAVGVEPGTFKAANITLIDRSDLVLVVTVARDRSGGPLWAAKRARKLQKPVIQKTFAVAPKAA